MDPVIRIGRTDVFLDHGALRWTGGLAVDADGCPSAYAPPESGLPTRDSLANAGKPGHWYGLVTDTGEKDGTPIIQGPGDPFPGYYVSASSLVDHARKSLHDPRRYVDAHEIPYIAIPPELRPFGLWVGDVARVEYRGNWCEAIVGDVGPEHHLGEGSTKLARQLSIPDDPRHGGCGAGVTVVAFPRSALQPAWPRIIDNIRSQVVALYSAWQATAGAA